MQGNPTESGKGRAASAAIAPLTAPFTAEDLDVPDTILRGPFPFTVPFTHRGKCSRIAGTNCKVSDLCMIGEVIRLPIKRSHSLRFGTFRTVNGIQEVRSSTFLTSTL